MNKHHRHGVEVIVRFLTGLFYWNIIHLSFSFSVIFPSDVFTELICSFSDVNFSVFGVEAALQLSSDLFLKLHLKQQL